jgi:hypothetical protein
MCDICSINLHEGINMLDIFAVVSEVRNTEYVSYTVLTGIFTCLGAVFAGVSVPMVQSLFKRFDKVDEQITLQFNGVNQQFTGVNQQFNGVTEKFNGVTEKFTGVTNEIHRLELKMVESNTLLKLYLLKDGVSFEQQEIAVKKAQDEFLGLNTPKP